MFKKLRFLSPYVFSILFLVCAVGVTHAAEGIVRVIQIQYPSRQISGSTTVVGVPGCQYAFTVVGNLPEGTHIEWKGHTTTKGSWNGNVLYPYQSGGGSGTYHIKAELVGGGGGGGSEWSVDVNGTITDPILTYSEPGEDTYFKKDQTSPAPLVASKVTVTKPGGTKLEGVSVLFIAKRSDNSVVSIGSNSSNSSGEATKTWNVPTSAVEVYTLKAGTGSNPNSLENEVTGKKVYVVEVVVAQDYDLWYFGGANADNYYEEVTLTAQGVTQGTFEWEVTAGATRVNLNNGGDDSDHPPKATDDNDIVVKSTWGSTNENDVTIKLTYNDSLVFEHQLSVFMPWEAEHDDIDFLSFGGGFKTVITYGPVYHQLDGQIPYELEVNEWFNEDSEESDYPGGDWWSLPALRGSGFTDDDNKFDDTIQYSGIHPDSSWADPPVGPKVDHWLGKIYAGSLSTGEGTQLKIKPQGKGYSVTVKWQRYTDCGRHE